MSDIEPITTAFLESCTLPELQKYLQSLDIFVRSALSSDPGDGGRGRSPDKASRRSSPNTWIEIDEYVEIQQSSLTCRSSAMAELSQYLLHLKVQICKLSDNRSLRVRQMLNTEAVIKTLKDALSSRLNQQVLSETDTTDRVRIVAHLNELQKLSSPAVCTLDQQLPYTVKTRKGTQNQFAKKECVTLVIPAAGRSSRFPGCKPKWMLTHPEGRLMIVESLSKLDLSNVKRVVVGVLWVHVQEFCGGDVDGILACYDDSVDRLREIDVTIVVLGEDTEDQVHTIECILRAAKIEGPVFFKDCDNQFKCEILPGDAIATVEITRLNEDKILNLASKGFVSLGHDKKIASVIEKEVISKFICAGGYSCSDAKSFLRCAQEVREIKVNCSLSESELALSDCFWYRMIRGHSITNLPCTAYQDWGTLTAWRQYCESFRTLFVDIDGTLVQNSGQYFEPLWGSTEPLKRNVECLQKLYAKERTKIVLVTSRAERYRDVTVGQLLMFNIPYDHLLLGMLHSQRILINDFAATNPYPTATAINLHRNSDELAGFLR